MPRIAAPWIAGPVLVALSSPVSAHPHVFIDTGLEVIFDQAGRVTGIRVTWTYDDFYTLMIMEERKLDPDGDGALTDAEKAGFAGFDMDWNADYPGDTYALVDGVPLQLSRPSEFTADVRDGKIVSTHLRQLDPPFRPEQAVLVVRSYDPGYYFSYKIPQNATLTGGAGCFAQLDSPDPTVTKAKVKTILKTFSKGGGLDQNFPRIGELLADEVKVTCSSEQTQAPTDLVQAPVAPSGGSDCWRAWFWLSC